MPLQSDEMIAMVTYIKWMGEGIPTGGRVKGDTLKDIKIPIKAADSIRGKIVYDKYCMVCHQKDGQGVMKDDAIAYKYPPVWGFASYQPGSSMHRIIKAAKFIKNNMPLGVTYKSPVLTDEEAIDVAAYINDDRIHKRPKYEFVVVEYPHIEDKPIDYHKPPYADKFSQEQHKFGPFQPIYDWRKENGQYLGY
jgi:thiosulfate dehydrogenase